MIGQSRILAKIDSLIENGFPRFVVISGQKGQGKTELMIEISKRLAIPFCNFGIKIDEIREMIDMAYKQTEPIIYVIQNADKMSIGAKNSLLKVIEEPPNNAYFIMELQQIENTLETIKSRCQEIKMDKYSENEIHQMIDKLNPNFDEPALLLLKDIGENYYQLQLLIRYNPIEFYKYVQKVYYNIAKVQSANSFKLSEKLDIKGTGEGYDLELFFNMYCYVAFEDMTQQANFLECFDATKIDIMANCIQITCNYKNKLNITGINKQSLIDMWILDIRKQWLK